MCFSVSFSELLEILSISNFNSLGTRVIYYLGIGNNLKTAHNINTKL